MLTGVVRLVFGNRITDMLSGYRVFSRRFAKSFPALATGFETETEFTVHALELHLPVGELRTAYRERPPGSQSKLNTYRDGLRILRTIVLLVRREKPLAFFAGAAAALALLSVILAWPVVATWLATGLVPRLPTAVLATGLMLLAFLVARLRPHPGYRDARPPGGEADRLSRDPRPRFPGRRPVRSGAGHKK